MSEDGSVDESEVRWLISYADFMMQLLCLFILLFSISKFEVSKLQAIEKSYKLYKGLPLGPNVIPPGPNQERKVDPTRDNPRGAMHVVGRTVPYQEGSAELLPDQMKELDELVQKHLIGTKNILEVRGHTSAFPEDALNGDHYYLSYLRALNVKKYLVGPDPNNSIIPEKQIRITACGEHDPLEQYDRDTREKARKANRRVEIFVLSETVR